MAFGAFLIAGSSASYAMEEEQNQRPVNSRQQSSGWIAPGGNAGATQYSSWDDDSSAWEEQQGADTSLTPGYIWVRTGGTDEEPNYELREGTVQPKNEEGFPDEKSASASDLNKGSDEEDDEDTAKNLHILYNELNDVVPEGLKIEEFEDLDLLGDLLLQTQIGALANFTPPVKPASAAVKPGPRVQRTFKQGYQRNK